MKNFLRAIRCSWPYRGRLFLSVICALFAAVLWSLNISAIGPVLEILGESRGLQDSVRVQINDLQKQVDEWQAERNPHDLRRKELESAPPSELRNKQL